MEGIRLLRIFRGGEFERVGGWPRRSAVRCVQRSSPRGAGPVPREHPSWPQPL